MLRARFEGAITENGGKGPPSSAIKYARMGANLSNYQEIMIDYGNNQLIPPQFI